MAEDKPEESAGAKTTEDAKPQESGAPAAEELKPQGDGTDAAGSQTEQTQIVTQAAKRRHAAYRPSHKATFIGLAVVAVILAVNGAALAFILRGQEEAEKAAEAASVTLSADTLEKLGVSRDPLGSEGVKLTINPETEFGGSVTIQESLSVAGSLNLNGRFTAPDAAFAKLQGGETALESLNVNGDATATNINARSDLQVTGATRLQGQVTISQLATVNNNLNVTGSLAVGGALSVKTLQVGNLQMTGDLRFGGHIITTGASPSASAGSASGSNGTESANGNDTAGTASVGLVLGSSGGVLATVSFGKGFTGTPHIVVTPVGRSVPGMYINRNANGFSIVTPSGVSPGGYAFDYIAIQ